MWCGFIELGLSGGRWIGTKPGFPILGVFRLNNPSYIISAFSLSLSLSTHRVTNHRPLPSGVSGGRRGRVIVRTLGGGSSTTP